MASRRDGYRKGILAVLVAAALSAGLAAAPRQTAPQSQPSYDQLARERFDVADKAYQQINGEYKQGLLSDRDMYYWLRRRAKARLKVNESRDERIKFLETYVAQLKEHERIAESRVRSGAAAPMNIYFAQYATGSKPKCGSLKPDNNKNSPRDTGVSPVRGAMHGRDARVTRGAACEF